MQTHLHIENTIQICKNKDFSKKDIPAFFKFSEWRGCNHFAIAEKLGYPVSDEGSLDSYFKAFLFVPEEKRADTFLFLDFETNTMNGFAVSMGAVLHTISTGKHTEIYELFNPIDPIDKEAESVHGISNDDVRGKKTFAEKKDIVLDLLEQADCIVAHNALYDIGVLVREFERIGMFPFPKINFLDTMSRLKRVVMAKSKTGRLKDATLEESANFFGIDTSSVSLHNSLEDAKLLSSVFLKAMDKYTQTCLV